MARKAYEGLQTVSNKYGAAQRKFERLALDDHGLPLLGLVEKLFGQANEEYAQAIDKPRFRAMWQPPHAKEFTLVYPFRQWAHDKLFYPSAVMTRTDYVAGFQNPRLDVEVDSESYVPALSLSAWYPESQVWHHANHSVYMDHNTYDQPSEAFYITPSSVGQRAYELLEPRMLELYNYRLAYLWQQSFVRYFTSNLTTVGQVRAIWPECTQFMRPYLAGLVDKAQPTTPGSVMRKYLQEVDVSMVYVQRVLREVVDSILAAELIDEFEPLMSEQDATVLKTIRAVFVNNGLLELLI